jgi:hypothetical protein
MKETFMSEPARLLTVQFLTWLAIRPRSYGEVKQAWRSTCPRLTTWEDALDEGLIEFAGIDGRVGDGATVALTERGREMLGAG